MCAILGRKKEAVFWLAGKNSECQYPSIFQIRQALWMRKLGRSRSGFTLMELAVVLAIMAILAVSTVPSYIDDINERRASLTAQETQAIIDGARAFRMKTGTWPDAPLCAAALNTLQSGATPYIGAVSGINKFNSPVSTSCTSQTFSVDQNIVTDWDGTVANYLPGTSVVSQSSHLIRTTIGVPGTEPALSDKLSRLANGNAELNRMRTTLLMGNNDITEVNHIDAASLAASGQVQAAGVNVNGRATIGEYIEITTPSVEGADCPSGSLISRAVTGQPLYCVQGKWSKPVTWYPGTVSVGQGCGSFPNGTMAFGPGGKLFVCK